MDINVFYSITILPTLVALLFFHCVTKWLLHKPPSTTKKTPPSPSKLPILGNLLQLSQFSHRSLHQLAKKHGPLMLLHLGRMPILIVSSADAAREVMKTHDLAFADRPDMRVTRRLLYDYKDIFVSPYGEHWRRLKSFCVLQLLSNKRVQSFHSIIVEEATLLVQKIRESSGTLNLRGMLKGITNDVICISAFGNKCSEIEKGDKFLPLLEEFLELVGNISIGDYVPWLLWISRVNGFDARVDKVAKEMDVFLEGVIQARMERILEEKANDDRVKNRGNFVDILLDLHQNESGDVTIDRDTVKAMVLDVFLAGTDSSSTVLEWSMSELLRHPELMKRLQDEVRQVMKNKHEITYNDLEKMHYLKAVIKETLRTHAPAPVIGRMARKEVKVMGYDVSAGTVVFVNSWAISMDPNIWEEPEKFDPDRFINSSIDFKGTGFEMIPFGAGRRGCPGIAFGMAVMELVLANLVHKFDWKLPEEVKELDMTELPGASIHRAVPLLAIASECDN